MANISVANTSADLSARTLLTEEGAYTIEGLHTFDRDPNPPFAVSANSAVVPNLDADKVDGFEGADLVAVAGDTMTGALQVPSGTVSAPGLGVGDSDVGLYSSGTNALDFTTAGTKALGIDSTQFIDSPTQPRAQVYNNTTQSINSATDTALTFNSEDHDTGALHDTGANTSRMTIPTGGDGIYLIQASASFAANATGTRIVTIRKNGTTDIGTATEVAGQSGNLIRISTLALVSLAAADYVEAIAHQTSGGALNTGHASSRAAQNQLLIVKLW